MAVVLSVQAQFNTDRITAIGRNALYFEDYVLSIQYFNQVIRLKPYLSETYQLRAIAKIQLGDLQGALQDCNEAIRLNPFQPGYYYARGYIQNQLGHHDLAEADLNEALHYAPENHTYILLRADTRARLEHYTEALEDISHLLRRDPKSASLHFEQGLILMSSKDTTAARQAFEKTTQLDSQNSAAWSALGLTQVLLNQQDSALISLNNSIRLGSQWAGDYINRGILHYQQHRYREAMADYDRAIELAPKEAQSYYNRGLLRMELGDYNNAKEDLQHALDLDAERQEIHYHLALVATQLRRWREALHELEMLMEAYPTFAPAYHIAIQVAREMHDDKLTYLYRQKMEQLEQQQTKSTKQPNISTQLASAQESHRDNTGEFSSSAAQNQDEANANNRYNSQTRGMVQKNHTQITGERNIALSYYAPQEILRRTTYYHRSTEQVNHQNYLPAPLRFTPQEIALTADIVTMHFEKLSLLSTQIEKELARSGVDAERLAHLYFARAIEFAIVQDYTSAMEDATTALKQLNTIAGETLTEALITFCRANWRYKWLDYERATGQLGAEAPMDFEIMLRDYDQVIKLCPDFSFAYYNKANMLCTQQEFETAIRYYSDAIRIDNEFAEAYFNRGLTYIYLGQNEQGIKDLSKAGELGIYQAYNLITRFNK